MKVNLAQSAGFCLGVKRAIDIALKTAHHTKEVYMLGDIVHNEDVIREIEGASIKKIRTLVNGRNKILLIRAHGAAAATFQKARALGFSIVDATCPMVKEIHRIAKDAEKRGCRIIVIGDKKHDEVTGIVGQLKQKALVIEDIGRIPLGTLKKIRSACVVVQSTQNMEKVLKIVEKLKSAIPRLDFFNTICRPTRIKQEEIQKMPLENDAMIIIGSRKSANTKRLYEISKSLNERSYWVNAKEEIKPEWLKNAQSVGVTAGASTPEAKIQEIINYLSPR